MNNDNNNEIPTLFGAPFQAEATKAKPPVNPTGWSFQPTGEKPARDTMLVEVGAADPRGVDGEFPVYDPESNRPTGTRPARVARLAIP